MEELVDVYDENTGEKTGEIMTKTEAHNKGIWHSAVHIIIINKDKTKVLLQKRCALKKMYPNMWDISVGGHISSNEEAIISAKRELKEELGLEIDNQKLEFVKIFKEEFITDTVNSKEFVYTYLMFDDINIENITLQKEEVSAVKWVDKLELNELIKAKEIINHTEEFEMLNEILN